VAARRGGRADRSPVADVSVAVVMARLMRRSAGRAASDQRH
jgi:hypothetical protein